MPRTVLDVRYPRPYWRAAGADVRALVGMSSAMTGPLSLRVPFGLLRGSRFTLDPRSSKQLYLGLWEREIFGWSRRLSTGARTAIDVGAGEGEYTLFFARLESVRRVIAVEPDQEMLSRLRANLQLNGIESEGCVQVVDVAVGAVGDREAKPLDSIVSRPEPPLVIKIDVEGAEADVLAGGMALLGLPDVRLLVETHGAEPEAKCAALLSSLGFEMRVVKRAWWRALVPERRPAAHNQWLVAWRGPAL